MGFGMTTVLLNIHSAGFFPISAMILAMGIFYGGVAQIIAGIFEFKKGDTFAVTAFISYGLFWLSLVALILAPKLGWADKTPEAYMGWYGWFSRCSCFLAPSRRIAPPSSFSVAHGPVLSSCGKGLDGIGCDRSPRRLVGDRLRRERDLSGDGRSLERAVGQDGIAHRIIPSMSEWLGGR
jgi:hypothetical protein